MNILNTLSILAATPSEATAIWLPVFFWTFALVSVLSSLAVLVVKDIVRCAFLIMSSLSGLAGLYLLLGAEFLAFTQIMVYVGGILILILFGVMLTNREPLLIKRMKATGLVAPGVLAGLILFTAIGYSVCTVDWKVTDQPLPADADTPARIGNALMSDFILPFEMASVLLLVALVGAAMAARRGGAEG